MKNNIYNQEQLPKNEYEATSYFKEIVPYVLFCIPIFLYYGTLYKYARNVPYLDDYDSILSFLVQFLDLDTFQDKIKLLFAQHNDHRIVFSKLIVLLTYYINKSINFNLLIFIGNLSILGICLFLYSAFKPIGNKALLFIPAVYLLFQFRYYEAILWAMVSLSGMCVIFFSLASLSLLERNNTKFFILSVFFATLATFTQGNGKLVLLTGFIMLLLMKRYRRSLAWLGISVIIFAFDLFFNSSFHGYSRSIFDVLMNPEPHVTSVFSFMGAVTPNIDYAIILGIALLLYFGFLSYVKYHKKNPVFYCFLVFILLNAFAVGYARPSIAFPSRYTMYSILLLVMVYISGIEIVSQKTHAAAARISRIFIVIFLPVSLLIYAALPMYLDYYEASVFNYEKNLVLSRAGIIELQKSEIDAKLKNEVAKVSKQKMMSIFPDSIRNQMIHNMSTRVDYIIKTEHWWLSHVDSFASSLKQAEEKNIYHYPYK